MTLEQLAVGRNEYLKIANDAASAADAQYKAFVTEMQTNQSSDKLKVLSGFGLPVRTNERGSTVMDERFVVASGDVTTYKVVLTDELTEEAEYFDPTGSLKDRARLVGNSMRAGREQACADMINRGLNASYPGIDGATFFSTSHTRNKGAAFANYAGASLDLNAENLKTVLTGVRTLKDAQGIPLGPSYTSGGMYLWHNPTLAFDVDVLLTSAQVPGSANNDANVVRKGVTGLTLDYVESTTAWGVCPVRKGDDANSVVFLHGLPMKVDDHKATNGSTLFRTREGYAVFWMTAQGWYLGRLS